MKLLVALGISIAIGISVPSQVAGLDLCDYAELPGQLGDLVEPAFKCQTASGYSFVTPSTLPTKAELSTICAKCSDLITAALAKGRKLPACQLVLDSGSAVTVDNFFQGIASECASNASSSNGGSSASASAGVVSVIPIVTTPPSSSPPATVAPSPASASTKSPGKGPADQPNDTTDSDDGEPTIPPEERKETDDSASDDDSTPSDAASSPDATADDDSTEDLSTGGSPSKSKTTAPTAVLTKTSSAIAIATGVTSLATGFVAVSLAVWSL